MSGIPPSIEAALEAAGRSQLEFDDNLLLPVLYGERDQHLDRMERHLGVSLVPRGNRISIAEAEPEIASLLPRGTRSTPSWRSIWLRCRSRSP